MKHSGSTLIIMLILIVILSSISVTMYESSLQNYQSSKQLKQRTTQFYQTEQCLLKANPLNSVAPLNISLMQEPLTWWQKHATPCQKHIWLYRELLLHGPNRDYIRVSAYHQQSILLQTIIATDSTTHATEHQAWIETI